METSQALPLHAVDDADLAEVVRGDPPFVSVYLRTEGAIQNAGQRSEIRWRNLRGALEAADVDGSVIAEIERLVPDAHAAGGGMAAIADRGGVRLVDHGPLGDTDDRAVLAEAPVLAPIIRWRQEEPDVLVVLADRRGADIFVLRRSEPDVERTVEGDDHPLRKVAPGGWSQRRFQERAENTWEENAQTVAEVVHRLADRVDPSVIVVAGDVRAVTLLQEALRDELRNRVHVVPGERPWEGSGDAIPDAVRDVVADAVRAEGVAVWERLQEEIGQHDLAVEGLDATVSALAQARVAVLVVTDMGDASIWVGPDPLQIATSADDLRALGVDEPREAAAVDAVIRAALAAGSAVRLYDTTDPNGPSSLGANEGPRDGVAALLRWADEASS
ncbi:MAG TPA: Vms1/Ankzf1 family peptidyl-tRNA hydrolase [Actinomycetota bacterium]|nr:Vms1/Ankzf1 family peptidyl-tRNA hydrolase [Actinomycetota bacterium]